LTNGFLIDKLFCCYFDQAVSTGDVNSDANVFQLIQTHQVASLLYPHCVCLWVDA
jgi:hypothetical protein